MGKLEVALVPLMLMKPHSHLAQEPQSITDGMQEVVLSESACGSCSDPQEWLIGTPALGVICLIFRLSFCALEEIASGST